MEPRELDGVLLTSLDPILKDLDVALTWQKTSREVQTIGSTMLVELRMRNDEQRTKQLMAHSAPSRPHAGATQAYEAEYWTTQEWEEYEAEGAGASDLKGRKDEERKKICSEYATKEGCPKGAMCYMVAKGGHPRMKDKCLRCGSEGHMYKACTRPSRQREARQNEAELDPETPPGDDDAEPRMSRKTGMIVILQE
eukprot:6485746-Amphidinium_carterae.1